ncbi:hypothetical protein C8R43DRAFT_1124359 [Mycena crocata]|nr:hypothetical protein C8R43DRAFT_1124359 [Mycena crocata]
MSSRSSTPNNDDDPMSDVFKAMAQSSPLAPTPSRGEKRARSAVDDDEDLPGLGDGAAGSSAVAQPSSVVNQNIAIAAARYADQKRLKTDQKATVDAFLHDPSNLREAKLLVHIMVLSNMVDKIITNTAPYQVSADLEKNISNYSAAVLLSSKIRTYKGSTPINILVEILKKHRFDLPAGIEHNPADFSKVIAAIQEALTQRRSKCKKLIKASLQGDSPKDHQNIFRLSQAFVEGSQCTVNVPLCARVALMRKVYLVESGIKFWDHVDANLASIRKRGKGDSKQVTRAFRHILTVDQEEHGSNDDEYDLGAEDPDQFQQDVDDIITANIFDAATTA